LKDQDTRVLWANATISSAAEEKTVQQLVDFMDNKTTIADFELDQQMRWNLLAKVAAFGFADASNRIAEEEKRDASDRGVRAATFAKASFPDAEVKAKAFERIKTDKESSLHIISSVMDGFCWFHQRPLLKQYLNTW
jgi:aminopeptidase N